MKTLKVGEPWGDDPLKYDLSELIAHGAWMSSIVKRPKDRTVTLRMESALLESAKNLAKEEGVGYQSLMRELIMEGISRRKPQRPFLAAERVVDRYPKLEGKKKASKAPRRTKA